jgi:hypothetical protein
MMLFRFSAWSKTVNRFNLVESRKLGLIWSFDIDVVVMETYFDQSVYFDFFYSDTFHNQNFLMNLYG